jgi:hypothetical protein
MAVRVPIGIPGWLVERLRVALDEHSGALRGALGCALVERTFRPTLGFVARKRRRSTKPTRFAVFA